jgi:hypothetical protein
MGSTPSDRKAVVNVDTTVARALRRIDQASAAAEAAAAEADLAPAVPAEDEAPPPGMTREQRRAVQAEIDRREALIEAKIRDKGKRKERPARPAPKPLPELVRPKSKRVDSLNDHVTTGPDGRQKVFSGRVMIDGEVRRTDIIDAEDFVRNINNGKQCFSCFGPADFILQYRALSYREIRDMYLALGFGLRQAEAWLREDFQRPGLKARGDGEIAGSAEIILCRRCYDRSGLEKQLPPDGMREVGERGLSPADSYARTRPVVPAPAVTGFSLPQPPAIAGLDGPLQAGLPGDSLPPPAAPPVPAAFARRPHG